MTSKRERILWRGPARLPTGASVIPGRNLRAPRLSSIRKSWMPWRKPRARWWRSWMIGMWHWAIACKNCIRATAICCWCATSRVAALRRRRNDLVGCCKRLTRRSRVCANCCWIASAQNSPAEVPHESFGQGNSGVERAVQRGRCRNPHRTAKVAVVALARDLGAGAPILHPRHGGFGQLNQLRQRNAERAGRGARGADSAGEKWAAVVVVVFRFAGGCYSGCADGLGEPTEAKPGGCPTADHRVGGPVDGCQRLRMDGQRLRRAAGQPSAKGPAD